MNDRENKKNYSQNNERRSYNRDGYNRRPERGNKPFENNRRFRNENSDTNFESENRGFRKQSGNSYRERNSEQQERGYNRNRNNYNRNERSNFNYNEGRNNFSRNRNRNYNNETEGEVFVKDVTERNFKPRKRTDDYNPHAKYSKKKQIIYKSQFADPNEPLRLNKFLANAGICSRREADEFISAGVVSVNDEIVTELGTKIKRTDIVKFHDQLVTLENKVYILLNKPKDCVTTSDDPQDRKTVLDLIEGACEERVYPVGRLDRNTTGVLLLTNDGDLAAKLTHPKFLKKKIYHVTLDKNVTRADLEHIAAGITLEDGEIHADEISYVTEEDKSQVGIEIHSGKNRIVRRIFESLGYKVKKLDRVFFAGLTKKGLRRGEWRFLTEKEVNMLRMGAFE